jgi:hypothetical protein
VAEELLEVLGGLDVLAEAFLRPHAVELLGQLAVRGDQVVAEQVDLLADHAARRVELLHGFLEPVEALLFAGEHRLALERLADALDEHLVIERLGQKVDRAALDRRDRAVHARGAR